MNDSPRYVQPKKATNFFNEFVGRLTRLGISVYGSRVLYVRGRKSGEWRSNPVNPLTVDGTRYLVAPRGTTQWVRKGSTRRPMRSSPLPAARMLRTHWVLPRGATRYRVPSTRSGLTGVVRHSPDLRPLTARTRDP